MGDLAQNDITKKRNYVCERAQRKGMLDPGGQHSRYVQNGMGEQSNGQKELHNVAHITQKNASRRNGITKPNREQQIAQNREWQQQPREWPGGAVEGSERNREDQTNTQ